MYKLLFILLLFPSCKQEGKHTQKSPVVTYEVQKKNEDALTDDQKKNKRVKKWIEYKKIPVMNQLDTIPYKDCYITIEDQELSYFRDGKLLEKRTMVRDKSFEYEVYSFKENPDDVLQYLDVKGERLVLKRDNYDGEQEYFLLKQ